MSLLFVAGSADRVACGAGASIGNLSVYTTLCWVYPTSLVNLRRIYNKGIGVHTAHGLALTGTAGDLDFVRGGSTTDISVTSSNTPLSVVNKWYCIAVTINTGVSPNGRMYVGTLSAPLKEVTYTAQVDLSGTIFDDSANAFTIGNRYTSTFNNGFPGMIGHVSVWNRVLPYGELDDQRMKPSIARECRFFMHLGTNGLGLQQDRSGYANNGTVTTATIAPHMPLIAPVSGQKRDVYYLIPAPAAAATTRQTYLKPMGIFN